jgi:DNA-binding MurR/RpiR family transcriptional regulator
LLSTPHSIPIGTLFQTMKRNQLCPNLVKNGLQNNLPINAGIAIVVGDANRSYACTGLWAMTSFEERIREARAEFSPSFATLGEFLLDSYPQVAFLTATELAHTLDLDPATVVRFAQRLGYAGYPELQREIRQKVKSSLLPKRPAEPSSISEASAEALGEAIRGLEFARKAFPHTAVESLITALDEAPRVILFAEGMAKGAALYLGRTLEAAGYIIHQAGCSPPELARAVAGIHKGDLALALEVEDETPLTARALQEAQSAGARTAALVAAPSSQTADSAEIIIASYAVPSKGMGALLIQALVFAIEAALKQARPRRYQQAEERVRSAMDRLQVNDTN